MKYIVIELQTNADGTVGNIVNAYDDRNAAESQYHSVLSAAAISNVPVHSCIMITSEGRPLDWKFYDHRTSTEA